MDHGHYPLTLYDVLGVPRNAHQTRIESAYRVIRLRASNLPLSKKHVEEFQHAYAILSCSEGRAIYDKWLDWVNTKSGQGRDADNERKSQRGTKQAIGRSIYPGILVTQGRIDGTQAYAIPDTGTGYNIMGASLASKLKLRIKYHKEGEQLYLRTANGRYIITLGIVEANWQFSADLSQTFVVTFYVLANCVYDIVLGYEFLAKTRTMSHHKNRLSRIPRPTGALSVLQVNVLGPTSRRVCGIVHTSTVLALPDSGSEGSLLSWKFIEESGLESLVYRNDKRLLLFADGSYGNTEGSIRTKWRYASSLPSEASNIDVEFHVFRDCIYDVIIGQDVLEETDAFLKHKLDFINVELDPGSSEMNLVIFVPKAQNSSSPETNVPIHKNDVIHEELQRRAKADKEIKHMPNSIARAIAEEEEEVARRNFDGRCSHLRNNPDTEHNTILSLPIARVDSHNGEGNGKSWISKKTNASRLFIRRKAAQENLKAVSR